MRKLIPTTLALLLASACSGYSDVPGIRTGDGDGEPSDGEPGNADGESDGDPAQDGSDAGTENPGDDAGADVEGAHLRFATSDDFGSYLVDGEGRTLYMRVTDTPGTRQTTCGDTTCATDWPPYNVEDVTEAEDLIAGRGMVAADLDVFPRIDGQFQISYKGRPLYYYAQDEDVGQIQGDSIDRLGMRVTDGSAVFYVARNYSLFLYQQTGVRPAGASQYNIPFLVDGSGRSLYIYGTDTPGSGSGVPVSKCTSDECIMKWPVFSQDPDTFVLPSSLDPDLFATYASQTGDTQVTFRGWPLYEFASDETAGDVKGHNVNDWTLIDPARFATADAAPSTGP